jgi:hypothetical protein
MYIETVAYDDKEKKYSQTNFSIDTTDFKDIQLEKLNLKLITYFEEKKQSYYKL